MTPKMDDAYAAELAGPAAEAAAERGGGVTEERDCH